MMVAVLLYAYARGTRSSRAVENRAKAYSARPTTELRLRELEREWRSAIKRLGDASA